ncbi:8127_t:CDS:2 [Paraglomus occultum]|uniref:8127_t:CDS:1 n=1 Tax=Paraglomus occultum TaxID=144539 RepID=A0A9N9BEH8_9GLOM|nr:8127_t:CDS:2 [Paraglomus occultum]
MEFFFSLFLTSLFICNIKDSATIVNLSLFVASDIAIPTLASQGARLSAVDIYRFLTTQKPVVAVQPLGLELAREYPNSYFAPVVLADEKPSNVEFVEYNVLDGLPFNSNSFEGHRLGEAYLRGSEVRESKTPRARAVTSVYTRPQWTELAIPEYVRVTKPGGWVELMEFDAMLRTEGPDCGSWLGNPGLSGWFTNIGYAEKSAPIGPKGEKYVEMGIQDWRDFWRGMKFPFSSVMQVSGEHYDAISEAAIKECIEHGVIWEHMRAWVQKKDRD